MKFFGLRRIDRALALCRKYGLNAVLDLHKAQGFSFNRLDGEDGFFESEAYQEQFYAIWECFAARYGALHETVAFELLNEVTKKEYLEAWKRISRECVRRIRLRAPETDGGQMWAGVMKIVRENRNAFDDVWLSTGINFPKLEWHTGQSARHAKAAADLRALGIGVSVQYQAATGLDAAEVENL